MVALAVKESELTLNADLNLNITFGTVAPLLGNPTELQQAIVYVIKNAHIATRDLSNSKIEIATSQCDNFVTIEDATPEQKASKEKRKENNQCYFTIHMFIFGFGDIPAMGAQGCGIATAISMWLSAIVITVYVLQKKSLKQYMPPWSPVAPNTSAIKEILVLGWPVGATMFLETSVFAGIALLVSSLGDTAIGAHQIAFNVWDMFYIPMLAIGSAMATRMGHALGAQNQQGVFMALKAGILCSGIISLTTMAVLLTLPIAIVSIYSESPDITLLAARLLSLAALFVIIDAVQIVGSFSMRAYKKTRFPFIASMVAYWLIALPLGYYLGIVKADNLFDGAAGFWVGIIVGVTVASTMIAVRLVLLLKRPVPRDLYAD